MAKDPKTGDRVRVPLRPSLPGEGLEQARAALLARADHEERLVRPHREDRASVGWLAIYAAERVAGELVAYFLYYFVEWTSCQSGSDYGDQYVKSGRATLRGGDIVTYEVRDEGSAHFGEWDHDYGDWDSHAFPEEVRRRLEATHARR